MGVTSGAVTFTMIRSFICSVSSIEPDGMKKDLIRNALMATERTRAVPTMTTKSIRKDRNQFFFRRLIVRRSVARKD